MLKYKLNISWWCLCKLYWWTGGRLLLWSRCRKQSWRLVTVVGLTCRHEEDPCAEDDVVAWLVELTGSYTQASHEEQDDTEDGEDAGGSNRTWKPAEGGGERRRSQNGMWFLSSHTERRQQRKSERWGKWWGSEKQREKSTLESFQHLLLVCEHILINTPSGLWKTPSTLSGECVSPQWACYPALCNHSALCRPQS